MLPFVPTFVPNLLQVAPFVFAFVLLCSTPLRKHPGPFYALWTILVVLVTWFDPVVKVMGDSAPFFALSFQAWMEGLSSTNPLLRTVFDLFTSSYTGVCFYLIVMFVGALRKTPTVKKLLSIRSEMSVIGGIVVMGHVVRIVDFPFLFANPVFTGMWGEPAAAYMFIAAVVIGPLLTVTFLVPWITSFRVVRNKMSHSTWKKTQKLAYPFMALMVGQGFFLAVGHALYGYPYQDSMVVMAFATNPAGWLSSFAQQVATAWLYALLGVGYVVLRLRKRTEDKERKTAAKESAALQGKVCEQAS